LVNYGNNSASFSANGFVLPKSVRRRPDFDIFPPDHGGNHAPLATPAAPAK
jgi:hypothetical protein